MASLSTIPKPISDTSFLLPKLRDSVIFLRNISVSGPKIRPLTRSNVFKNSNQTLFSSEGQCSPTFDVPLLSSSEVIERMRTSRESQETKQLYLAMYSSVFGGITTDTAAMVIPMDDHMVHRGHGVFDTAAIMDGKGSLRYWLSAGPGDFQLSPSGCPRAVLYAIVIQDQSPPDHRGIRVVTSSIPIKPPQFAVMKSVNYLPNALSKMEAEENDAYAAIWLDGDGFVAEGPNMNVAFVTKEKELLMPSFDKILSGCTAKRVLVLAAKLVKEGKLRGIRVDNVSVEDGKRAEEMMLIGSGVLVRSVVQWDEEIIGDGREGPVTQALLNLLLEDMKSGPASVRVRVPY
ncbi:D-amino-acid transaminase, chloroplastic isoform X2 [Nicotiana sylvestris]|uniref:D-amino-acid transaminase, chloroplastic isoform X2 n=1 Tax=Nicotiana tabacum TaxID=4097 RepID=A0A1S3ZMZ9_TOBAC|nr:PREDICTED: D-amino-acid transaminase, chloroplastic-like isoform X2 [Nicotiana tabacum]